MTLAAVFARKPWLSMQALMLLNGHQAELIEGDDGKPMLVVSRGAFCKQLTTLEQAQAWLECVSGHEVS